jgi:eukaryotic-like serine/threonine-protein kinase
MTRLSCQIFVTLFVVILLFTCLVRPVIATEYSVAHSGSGLREIQQAIDFASPGDTIFVTSGMYPERIRIDKPVMLVGINNGRGAPVIEPYDGGTAVEILAEGCTVQGFQIQNSNLASAVHVTSSRNTIADNIIKNNAAGISLVSANNNFLNGNTIIDSTRAGVILEDSRDNVIDNNRVIDNAVGITLDASSRSNHIYHNSFANTQNVLSKSSTSEWNSPVVMAYTYLGRKTESQMGNYWSDYRGRDPNGDGIGNTPYTVSVSGNKNAVLSTEQVVLDLFPLIDPKDYYTAITPTLAPGLTKQLVPTPVITLFSVGTTTSRTYQETGSATPVPTYTASDVVPNLDLLSWTPALLVIVALFGIGGVVFFRIRKNSRGLFPAGTPAPVSHTTTHAQSSTVAPKRAQDTTIPVAEEPDLQEPEQKSYFPPELENKYTGISYIGRGGVAHVFVARRKSDDKLVAIKIPISFDELTGRCFLNEIAAWEKLRHPNIVEVLAVNILPVPYVEMEYVPGSLGAVEKPVPISNAVYIINSIADALHYAHSHGIIHRDIKPHNILITEDFVPKITDWGMSKIIATEMNKSSVGGFSLSYAAPEQVSPADFGRTDARTDIYQLGVVFYELVTGSIPFGGESVIEVGNAIVRENPALPSEYNPDAALVEKIILRCLEKDPADRYQSASELMDALAGYLDEDEG